MRSIYDMIISKTDEYKNSCTPISEWGHIYNFVNIDIVNEKEYYRSELVLGKEKIILSIWGSDHSGELTCRKDTYHNVVEYWDTNGNYHTVEYMYLAE